jgi:hypothetical protein
MPIKLIKSDSSFLRLIQLGESGSGKSRRAADATRWGRVYFFDFDGKINNLMRMGHLTAEQADLIDYDTYTDTSSAIKFAESLKANNPYQTVVVDTSSIFNQLAEVEVRAKKKLAPDAKFSYDEWGQVLGICNTFFYMHLLPLKCHIIINSHVKTKEQADGTEILDAAGAGGFAVTLKQRMTDSQYLTKKGGKYLVQVKASDRIAINSPMPADVVDSVTGCLKVSDLSVFDARLIKKI